MEKEPAVILVEQEVFVEAGERVLKGVERVREILDRMDRCGYGVKGVWQGESGMLCRERMQEISGEGRKALKEIRQYVKEVQEIVQKGQKQTTEILPDLPGDFLE